MLQACLGNAPAYGLKSNNPAGSSGVKHKRPAVRPEPFLYTVLRFGGNVPADGLTQSTRSPAWADSEKRC